MRPVILKIKEYLKKNKSLVLLVSGILVLVLIFLSFLPNSKYSGVALVEQPLFFYKSQSIDIPKDVSKNLKIEKKGYAIYKIKSENLNIKVDSILTQLSIGTTEKTAGSVYFYQWKNKSGDVVIYDTKSQDMTINLVNKKNIFPNLALPSDEQLLTLLPDFVKKYVNSDFDYFDTNVIKDNGNYKIEGRRKIGNLPLSFPGNEKYHDYIYLDGNLNLLSARISLIEFEANILDKLILVKPVNLDSVISKESYPKAVNQGLPDGINIKATGKVIKESDNLDNIFPKSTKTTVSEMSVVYYFSNVDQQFLAPVYRLEGEGKVVFNGNEYNLPIVIFASAINPDYVYIPSNISFAD